MAVQAGQWMRLPAPYPVPFWLQRVSLLRWVTLTMAHHTFACAVHRCLLDGIPGERLPGSAVYPRFRPLRTSRRSGGYAVTPAPGGEDFHPHGNCVTKPLALRFTRGHQSSFDQRGARNCNAIVPQSHGACSLKVVKAPGRSLTPTPACLTVCPAGSTQAAGGRSRACLG